MGFLPSSDRDSTTVGMHHMDANKMHKEKGKWELHKNATRMNKSWKQHPTKKKQLYGHSSPISQIIQVR